MQQTPLQPNSSSTLSQNQISNVNNNNNNITNTKKRRRKIIKACLFCRKRKLKCNLDKPKCQQCKSRCLPSCIYTNSFNFDVSEKDIFSDTPNIELVSRIIKLEEELRQTKNHLELLQNNNNNKRSVPPSLFLPNHAEQIMSTIDKCVFKNENSINEKYSSENANNNIQNILNQIKNNNEIKNPYWDLQIMGLEDNLTMVYGPTSWRMISAPPNTIYNSEYQVIWDIIKPARLKLKVRNSISVTLLETRLLQYSFTGKNTDSIITELVNFLPQASLIENCLTAFFKSSIHETLGILDPEKVIQDYFDCFVKDPYTQRITMIVIPDGNNYFKIGNIILILSLTYFENTNPDIIDIFLSVMSGPTCASLRYIERSQFLTFFMFRRIYFSYACWSESSDIELISQLVQTCLNFGLDDIGKWYLKGKIDELPKYLCLYRTWLWVCFYDVCYSFDVGRKSLIPDDYIILDYDYHKIPNINPLTIKRLTIFSKYLKLTRSYLNEINSKFCATNLDYWVNEIIHFIKTNFEPIQTYTSDEIPIFPDKIDNMLLVSLLSMLSNTQALIRLRWGYIRKTYNSIVQYCLISLKVCINTIKRSTIENINATYQANQDNHFSLSSFNTNPINFSNFLLQTSLRRVLTEIFSLLFYEVSQCDETKISLTEEDTYFKVDLNSLDVDPNIPINLNDFIKNYSSIYQGLFPPENRPLQEAIKNSYSSNVSILMERVARGLYQRLLKIRKTAADEKENQSNNNNQPPNNERINHSFNSKENNDNKFNGDNNDPNIGNNNVERYWNDYKEQTKGLWESEFQDLFK